jgi:hypothetical protein
MRWPIGLIPVNLAANSTDRWSIHKTTILDVFSMGKNIAALGPICGRHQRIQFPGTQPLRLRTSPAMEIPENPRQPGPAQRAHIPYGVNRIDLYLRTG